MVPYVTVTGSPGRRDRRRRALMLLILILRRGGQGGHHAVRDRRGGRRVRGLRQGARLRDPLVHLVLEDGAGLQRDDPALLDGHRALRRGVAGRALACPWLTPERET